MRQEPRGKEQMFKRTDPSLGKPKPVSSSYGYEDAMRHGYLTEMEKQGSIGVQPLAVRLNAQSPGTPTKAEAAIKKPQPIATGHQARRSRAQARSNAFVSAIRI